MDALRGSELESEEHVTSALELVGGDACYPVLDHAESVDCYENLEVFAAVVDRDSFCSDLSADL